MSNTRMDNTLRVIFAGGASGGHLMPGVATARALERAVPGCRTLFLTSESRTEKRCRGALAGFDTAWLPDNAWRGAAGRLLFPARSLWAAGRMVEIVRGFRPHVVLGLGSYNCAVPVLVARAFGVKTALLEANARPGAAVRLLAPFVDSVMVQWGEVIPRLKLRRAVVTGLPVREHLLSAERGAALCRLGLRADRPTLLATGGSQGALALNKTLYEALRMTAARGVELQVIHLTGIDHLQAALDERAGLGAGYRPFGFLGRMEDAYAAADFALARTGGSTLAELTALGLPSILVPHPYGSDHQRHNAELLGEVGAAMVIAQSELTAERLCDALTALACDLALRRRMAERALHQGQPDAAARVAGELAALAGFVPHMEQTTTRTEETPGRTSRAA